MTNKLYIHGGNKIIDKAFANFNTIGQAEINSVVKVMKSGVLSKFLGENDPDFYGGPKVIEFQNACQKFFNVKHAIAVNSWTSGLTAAVGALDIEPGDEIITSTVGMCASATAILQWNCIPVFADIDAKTFNIDPKSIEKNISKYTKAIIATDIYGQSSNINEIKIICNNYNLKLISDTAQSPGSLYDGRYSGTLADIGGYSLNYHKHIHTGEGGILVTNNDEIAERLRLIRNHGEAVVEGRGLKKINNIIGGNFRLGEIESAIGIEQLKKLKTIVSRRQEMAQILNKGLVNLNGLIIPFVEDFNTHSYYVYALKLDISILKIDREKIITALRGEGLAVGGKFSLIHEMPLYQNKIAYGSQGFPWSADICKREVNYNTGICPIAEELNSHQLIIIGLCSYEYSDDDLNLIIECFHKVWSNLNKL